MPGKSTGRPSRAGLRQSHCLCRAPDSLAIALGSAFACVVDIIQIHRGSGINPAATSALNGIATGHRDATHADGKTARGVEEIKGQIASLRLSTHYGFMAHN